MNSVDISYIFLTVVTFFVIMLIGVTARIFGVLDAKSTKRLSSFVVNVAQPLLIICAFQTEYTSDKLKIGVSLLVASGVLLVLLSVFARFMSRFFEKGERAVLEFGMVFSNWTYLSYPILGAVFGEAGYFYGAFFTLFFNVYIRLYGISILNRGRNNGVFKKAIFNSGTLAAIIGILMFVFKIHLPDFIREPFKIVGDMTFPLSMIVVGSLVCNQPLKYLFKVKLYWFSFAKLLIAPLVTLTVCALMHVLFGFDKGMSYICVIMTSLPASTDTALFGELYKGDSSLGASCVGVTTMFSVVTIPLMLWLAKTVLELIK